MSRIVLSVLMAFMLVVCSASAQGAPSPAVTAPERIELPGGAGEALYWQGGPRAVLLVHGAIYDAASWEEQATVLRGAGYTVLSVEDISAEATQAGIAWLLEERDAVGVVVIGASAGGGGALRALAGRPEGVAGLVLLGATGDVGSLGDYPKLFTASEGEGMAGRLEEMAEASAGDRNRVEIIPGDAHAQATFGTPQGERLLDAILAFLDEDAAWPTATATPDDTQ